MLRRLTRLSLLTMVCAALGVPEAGCGGMYSAEPEQLKKPRKQKKKDGDEDETAEDEDGMDEECRTNFYDEPTDRRRPRKGRNLAKQADRMLFTAEGAEEESERTTHVVDALAKLENALGADPYGPEPTYQMAVAYALVGKKGCSLRLLERLAELQKHPDVSKEAERAIKRALNDMRFDAFRKEADTALGN